MADKNGSVKVQVSRTGVRSVSPADIFQSAKGQQQIQKTARAVSTDASKGRGESKPAK